MMNLLNEKWFDKITGNARTCLSKSFVTFGSVSADVLAVCIIVRFMKLIIDTIIHKYALHSTYRCGIHHSSRNMEFRHPPSPLPRQTNQGKARESKREE